MSSANGPSSPANCIGFTRPWRMTPARGPALAIATTRATLAEARLSDFKSMLDDIREQRDRWQQQAERLAALAITDQRKERSPAQPQSWRQMLRAPTGQLLFLWVVGLLCGGVLLSTVGLILFLTGLGVTASRRLLRYDSTPAPRAYVAGPNV